MFHSLGLTDINGITYSASKGPSELKAQVYLFPKPGPLRGQTHQWMLWIGTVLGSYEPLSHTWYSLENVWMSGGFFQVIRTLKAPCNVLLGLYKVTQFLSLLRTLVSLYIYHTTNWEKSMGFHLKSLYPSALRKVRKLSFLLIPPPAMGFQ